LAGGGDSVVRTPEVPPKSPVTPTEFLAQVADAQTGDDLSDEPIQESIPIPTPAPAPTEEAKPKNRSRVGSMFDLLSFNEV